MGLRTDLTALGAIGAGTLGAAGLTAALLWADSGPRETVVEEASASSCITVRSLAPTVAVTLRSDASEEGSRGVRVIRTSEEGAAATIIAKTGIRVATAPEVATIVTSPEVEVRQECVEREVEMNLRDLEIGLEGLEIGLQDLEIDLQDLEIDLRGIGEPWGVAGFRAQLEAARELQRARLDGMREMMDAQRELEEAREVLREAERELSRVEGEGR